MAITKKRLINEQRIFFENKAKLYILRCFLDEGSFILLMIVNMKL